MKKLLVYSTLIAACGTLVPQASAQKYAIKGYDNIGLGSSMSIQDTHDAQSSKSGAYNAFGLDFGYTFWRKGAQSLEANIGIGYSNASAQFSVPELNFAYNAPAAADEDKNEYIRYSQLSDLTQSANLAYVTIPLYLDYQYKPLKWLGIHAQVGFGFGFRTGGSVGKINGQIYSFGVFPEYDDLKIDEDYLDSFGQGSIAGVTTGKPSMKGFDASVILGAGLEFYAYEPVSFEIGIRYQPSMTQAFTGKYDLSGTSDITRYEGIDYRMMTPETAPVTYTVADGYQMKSLSDYTSKSRLAPLSLHLGINIRF